MHESTRPEHLKFIKLKPDQTTERGLAFWQATIHFKKKLILWALRKYHYNFISQLVRSSLISRLYLHGLIKRLGPHVSG